MLLNQNDNSVYSFICFYLEQDREQFAVQPFSYHEFCVPVIELMPPNLAANPFAHRVISPALLLILLHLPLPIVESSPFKIDSFSTCMQITSPQKFKTYFKTFAVKEMLQYCCVLSSGYLSRLIYFKKSPDIKIYLTILAPKVHAIAQMILLHFFLLLFTYFLWEKQWR